MININLDKEYEPTLQFTEDKQLTHQEIASVIFYLETNVYTKLFIEKLQAKLSPGSFEKILTLVNSLHRELDNNFDRKTLRLATTPIVSPLQE